jgi:lysozyme family protein
LVTRLKAAMDKFTPALQIALRDEGGYVFDKNDPGGETNYGISKREYPYLDIKALTPCQAGEIYKKDYWQEAFNEINSQEIVNKTFSVGIDIGMYHAITCLQRAVRAASGVELEEDGILGDETLTHINSCNAVSLLSALKSEMAGYYRRINNPCDERGWLDRAYE